MNTITWRQALFQWQERAANDAAIAAAIAADASTMEAMCWASDSLVDSLSSFTFPCLWMGSFLLFHMFDRVNHCTNWLAST